MKSLRNLLLATLPFVLMAGHAYAAATGSSPEYPEGNTLGLPTGALPPPGVYITFKPSYAQSRSTNAAGHFTGAHAEVFGATGSIAYIPGIKILGANYGMFIRSIGSLNVSLTTPPKAGSKTFNRVGLVDTEFVPVSLSWPLGHHLFVNGEFGFYPPDGQYSKTAVVNNGQNHWTIEPDASISYLPPGYQFTIHGTIDKNFENPHTHYTNGDTVDFDFTAMKLFGRFGFGPVSYYYKQITADQGPQNLNGGSPMALAFGADASFQGKGYRINAFFTHDVVYRNVGDVGKIVVSFIVPL